MYISERGSPVLMRMVRSSAAQALYQTDSQLAITALLTDLKDPDPGAAFAVMQGLGNLTKQYEWRPKTTEPNADWFRCLSHWREFGQDWKRPITSVKSAISRFICDNAGAVLKAADRW